MDDFSNPTIDNEVEHEFWVPQLRAWSKHDYRDVNLFFGDFLGPNNVSFLLVCDVFVGIFATPTPTPTGTPPKAPT